MQDDGAAARPLSASAQWTALELEVLAPGSDLTPLVAEELARLNGWPWRSWRVEAADRIALDAGRWPWSTACGWITARTRDKAEEAVAALRKWGGCEWRNLIGRFDQERTLGNAETELRNALAAGSVKAWGFYGGRPVTIPAAEWPALDWRRGAHGEPLAFDDLLMLGEPRYRLVTVARAEVMRLWPTLDGWDPDGAASTVEEPPAAAEIVVDVEFRPVAEEVSAFEVPVLRAGTAEPKVVERSSDAAQGAEARAARSSHAQRRIAFLREKVPDLSKPGAKAALRKHSDEYQKLHGKDPVERSQHAKDVKMLRVPRG